MRSRVQGRGALPRLDLCAAGLSGDVGALFPEGAAHPPAAQAMLRVGRGALTAIALTHCPNMVCENISARGAADETVLSPDNHVSARGPRYRPSWMGQL